MQYEIEGDTMINVVDSYCWEEHRKVLTTAETKIPALQTFGICSQNRAGQPLRTHIHQGCMEIVYLVKGFQVYEVGGVGFNLSGSDIFVAYPGEPHSSGSYPESVCDLIWMQVNLTEGIPFFGLDEKHGEFLRQNLLSLPRLFSGDALLRNSLTDAFYALASEKEDQRYMAEQQLAFSLFRMKQLSQKPVSRHADSIGEAIAYIHGNLSEPILLEEAAACCGLSLSRFKVKFKDETGVTPREYINHVKIEQAKRFLEKGKSVTETALDLGFTTPNYFAVIFRKYTGLSPSIYQARSSTGENLPSPHNLHSNK